MYWWELGCSIVLKGRYGILLRKEGLRNLLFSEEGPENLFLRREGAGQICCLRRTEQCESVV